MGRLEAYTYQACGEGDCKKVARDWQLHVRCVHVFSASACVGVSMPALLSRTSPSVPLFTDIKPRCGTCTHCVYAPTSTHHLCTGASQADRLSSPLNGWLPICGTPETPDRRSRWFLTGWWGSDMSPSLSPLLSPPSLPNRDTPSNK